MMGPPPLPALQSPPCRRSGLSACLPACLLACAWYTHMCIRSVQTRPSYTPPEPPPHHHALLYARKSAPTPPPPRLRNVRPCTHLLATEAALASRTRDDDDDDDQAAAAASGPSPALLQVCLLSTQVCVSMSSRLLARTPLPMSVSRSVCGYGLLLLPLLDGPPLASPPPSPPR